MLGLLLRRLGASLVLVWVVVTATFAILHLAPGDPISLILPPQAPPAAAEQLRASFGLDKGPVRQYFSWLEAVVLRGDWGLSFSARRPTIEVLGDALPNTALLALCSLLVTYGLGISLGILAATRPNSFSDQMIRGISMLLFAIPSFWLATIAVELLAVRLPWFPIGQMRSADADFLSPTGRLVDLLHHMALPALTLGLANTGGVIRLVRNGLLDIFHQDFIRTARAKGASPTRVMWRHALPNIAGPLVQRFGLALPFLLGGSLIIEVIYSWPGIGRVSFAAIQARDYPVVLAGTTLTGLLVVGGNLLADLLHAWIDPRLRDA